MKKIYTLSFILLTTLSFGQLTETFSGTGLLSTNGWTLHSGTAGQLTISSGSLTYAGLTPTGNKVTLVAGSTEDVNKSVGTAITTAAYYSAILNFPNITGLTTTGDYSIALGAQVGASVSGLYGRLFLKTGVTANTFNIGIVNTSTGSTANYMATDYPIGTPIFIVVKYDRSNNTAYLFVNPALDSTEPVPSLTNATGTTAAPASIASVCFRQAGNVTAGTGNVEYDDVRAGSTWAYATTSALVLSLKQNTISGLSVYPNPVKNGNLFITSNSNNAKSVTVFDILGKQVLNTKISNNAVNVSNLKGGAYIVRVTEDGKTDTRKLIIE
ncbi:T9SS type A sorting domain-containing protein [Flavobacterium franklandianum]|uniref:T9SS type A sorting domain-containing protein n=1 Tax=Flavobacterium franklandianum TaxID=2594430 RepID=A0A553CL01_9FLAO|nr:T9SS type A sorting domain-containing protein [Flavobacterium franklandianum]TRX21218.1 T9SS type A sorting domain-containing protein [Flavobacterium franklandianum]TRX30131.1 T9SS type A sorting domain-containing protein [Flavobacterium franklandianum]